MNKFKQVSSDGHQMSFAGGGAVVGDESPRPDVGGGGRGRGACTVRSYY